MLRAITETTALMSESLTESKSLDDNPAKNKIFEKVKKDIESFDPNKLRKRKVYMVGGPPESFLSSCLHSFPVVGAVKTKKNESSYCSLRYLGANIMFGHYVVSESVINKVIKSKHFSQQTKSAIQTLRGQVFPSVEIFFRRLLEEREEKIPEEELFAKAAFPDEELQKLAKFNEDLNYERGVVTPSNPDEGRRKKDRDRFEHDSWRLTIIPYPNIEPEIVDDVFNQLKLYMFWMSEQAGIGKSTEYWLKQHVHPEKTKQIIDSMVHYKSLSPNPIFDLIGASLLQFLTLPNKDMIFETNCNKSSASLLDEAEKRSAEKQHRLAEEVKGPTWFHNQIGSAQRISIWNPLRPNFIGIIKQLVSPTHVNYPIPSLHELIKNRKNILHVLRGFELPEQIKTLEQMTDSSTLLGKAFAFTGNQNESEDLITAKKMLVETRQLYDQHKDAILSYEMKLRDAKANQPKI